MQNRLPRGSGQRVSADGTAQAFSRRADFDLPYQHGCRYVLQDRDCQVLGPIPADSGGRGCEMSATPSAQPQPSCFCGTLGTLSNRPILVAWQKLRIRGEELESYFGDTPQNIGAMMGELAHTEMPDLDLDWVRTAAMELAPDTGMVFGRESKPASHRFYRCDPPVRSVKYQDPVDKKCNSSLRWEEGWDLRGFPNRGAAEHPRERRSCTVRSGIRPNSKFDIDGEFNDCGTAAPPASFARHWPRRVDGTIASWHSPAASLGPVGAGGCGCVSFCNLSNFVGSFRGSESAPPKLGLHSTSTLLAKNSPGSQGLLNWLAGRPERKQCNGLPSNLRQFPLKATANYR